MDRDVKPLVQSLSLSQRSMGELKRNHTQLSIRIGECRFYGLSPPPLQRACCNWGNLSQCPSPASAKKLRTVVTLDWGSLA